MPFLGDRNEVFQLTNVHAETAHAWMSLRGAPAMEHTPSQSSNVLRNTVKITAGNWRVLDSSIATSVAVAETG